MAVKQFQYFANIHRILRQLHVANVVSTSEFRASSMLLLRISEN